MVLAEARRLEEAAHRNEDELRQLVLEQRGNQTPSENLLESSEDPNLRAEIMQLKHRLAGTDQELQKTNLTLRYTTIQYSKSSYFGPKIHLDEKGVKMVKIWIFEMAKHRKSLIRVTLLFAD